MLGHTIAALATPVGAGGIAVVRVSGVAALDILEKLSGRGREEFADRVMTLGWLTDTQGQRRDKVLFVAMRGPRSYTGEDVVEIHGHGGRANAAALVAAVLAAGARLAEPGEFSRRAFARGRLDLPQVEAVLALVEAESEHALRAAQGQLCGQTSKRVADFRTGVTAVLAKIEAAVDFPEEDLPQESPRELAEELLPVARAMGELLASFRCGRVIRSGLDVILVGPVNAGKSSLLNALVGEERALVDSEPGTTRDFVEVRCMWDGILVTLVDVAGFACEGVKDVERRGIVLGQKRAQHADIVLHLVPAQVARDRELERIEAAGAGRVLPVISKVDEVAGKSAEWKDWPRTSARTGEGLVELKEQVLNRFLAGVGDASNDVLLTSERQRAQLASAVEDLARGRAVLAAGEPLELAALSLRAVERALAAFLGVDVEEAVLDELFSRFCIGK